uniref:Uncharacterized protein n=1 Tax=Arundo donax TaxID=35708 RepID=A0A0A9AXM4_ARUDO
MDCLICTTKATSNCGMVDVGACRYHFYVTRWDIAI